MLVDKYGEMAVSTILSEVCGKASANGDNGINGTPGHLMIRCDNHERELFPRKPNLAPLDECALSTGVPIQTLHAWVRKGYLCERGRQPFPARGGGKVLVDKEDVLYLKSHPPRPGRPKKTTHAVGGINMEKKVVFERLYQLLKDTADVLIPQPEVNVAESLFFSDLLSQWQHLCLELSGYSLEEFKGWARHKEDV